MSQQFPTLLRRSVLIALPVVGVLALAGCSGSGSGSSSGSAGAQGFSIMVAQANDQDNAYQQIIDVYTKQTGVPVEVIPYPADAYNTQVTTQLQAGNSADMMILSPGTGQPVSVDTLATAGFLEPLDDTSAGVIPDGTQALYQLDGKTYGQPTSLTPLGLIYNAAAASSVGVQAYPKTYEDLLSACGTAKNGGKSLVVLAGSAPPNTGLTAQLISASLVYGKTPDWNQQRADGKVTFAGSAWKDVLQTIVDMNTAGCFEDGAVGGTFDTITANMTSGQSIMTAAPGPAATSLGQAAGTTMTVNPFPAPKSGSTIAIASANYAFGIATKSDSARKAAAQAFLDWFADPANSAQFASIFGAVPLTASTSDLSAEYAPLGDYLKSGDYVGLPNATWPNAAVYDALGTGVQALLTGQKTVDQVLADMDAAWNG